MQGGAQQGGWRFDKEAHLRCDGCDQIVRGNLERHLGQKPTCRAAYDAKTPMKEEKPTLESSVDNLAKRQCQVLFDVSGMRNEDLVGAASLSRLKEDFVPAWVESSIDDSLKEISQELGEQVAEKTKRVMRKNFDFFAGMRTQAQEESLLAKTIPVLKTFEHDIAGGEKKDRIDAISIHEWLQLLLRHDKTAADIIVDRSEAWKRGDCAGPAPDVISDFDEAKLFRKGRFGRKATPAEANDLRVFAIVAYDGLELVSRALGDKKGNHSAAMCYLSIGDPPALTSSHAHPLTPPLYPPPLHR